jgi:hypothetical protein
MARKIKVDNAELKRRSQKESKRRVGGIPLRKYYLIVCEGIKTEPNYFRELRKKLPIGIIDCIEIEGEGKNTLSLIEETDRIRKDKEESIKMSGRKFDHTWAVFDRDSFPSDNFDNSINKGENMKRKINCAWTNEAFELWYLLHLEFVNAPLSRDDYEGKIEKWLSSRMGQPFTYRKNREDMYEILNQYGDEQQAVRWSKILDEQYHDKKFSTHNPRTKVYLLIQELNKLLPKKDTENNTSLPTAR